MVEWKKLDTLLDFEQPTPYLVKSTEYNDSYDVPVLTAGQSLLLGYTNETKGIFKASKDNPTIIFDDFTTSFHWIDFDFKVKSSAMKMLRPKKGVNFRFVYYSMRGISFVPGGHQRHWISKYSQFKIPIPSLSEQQRIVDILDTFTASIENLKEQIAERRKQYEYERDQLLDLEGKEGVEMKTLGEVCVKNQNIKWKSESADKYYDYIDLSSVSIDLNSITETTEINKENAPSRAQQIVKDGDVLLGTTRPTLKRYCQVPLQYDNQICSTGYCVLRAKTECVLSRWIFHNIGNRKFWDYCEIHQQGAGYPCLSNSDAFSYRIPLPSLSEQASIVSILDTFEASIANLEAQLELRQKQYEYYRNQLLMFE